MSDTNGGYTEGDSIEWHHQKITEYFTECGKIYDTFEQYIDEVALALNDFVNDSEHRGPEAESSKAFVNERQLEAVQEAIYSIEHLHGMMIGGKLSDEVSLVDDFNEKVDASENAIVKSQQLDKIIKDYTDYNNDFRTKADTIKTARDACQEAIAGCSFLTYSKFTEPDPEPTKEAFEEFVSVEGEDGFVQKFKKTFLDFMEEHSDDFSNSEFMAICPALLENLRNVNAALGDGSFDLTRYYETFQNVKWTDVKDLLSEEDRQKFLKFLETFRLYLKGLVPRCQVYKYDPVNMCNGNYINDRTDLTVPGRFPISFRRFYNAQSDNAGFLGKGWSCSFDGRLRKDKDGDYRLNTFDGRELVFSKEKILKEEVYLEIHGEEGTLREIDNGFRITMDDGTYDEYDIEGFFIARGNGSGENTTIDYTTVYVRTKSDDNSEHSELVALPVRISTVDGTRLCLKYNDDAIITDIEDQTGRGCHYDYEIVLRDRNSGKIVDDICDDYDLEKEYHLISVTYPNEAVRRYDYDEQGLICSVYSPDGIVALTNEYDSKRRVTRQTFPDGGEMSYEYDDEKHITTATEQNGCKVQYLSDELGRHIGTRYVGIRPGQTSMDETDDGYVIEEKYTYSERNQKTTVTDRNGFITRYSYDKRGRRTSVIGPEGLHETFTYDAQGKLTSKKDSEGNQYKYVYNEDGSLYLVTDPLGNKTRYFYEDGKVVTVRDASGNKKTLTYDEKGNVSSITEKTGVTTRYEYDDLGRAIKTIDADGNETRYTFDDSDNVTSVTDPLGNATRYSYNQAGLLTEVVNPDGTKKTWEYNEIGKPALFTDEDGHVTEMIYNTSWEEEKIILPNGGEISYTYDLLGNRILETDPEGRETKHSYDKAGNELFDGSISYTYDGKNRVKTKTDGVGNVTTYEYDKNDNLICTIDAKGGKTLNEYDALNRLTKTTDPVGRVTITTYDKDGNVKTTTDAAGLITENYYDKGKIVKVTKKPVDNPDNEITIREYIYDSCGRIAKQTEIDGYTIEFSYDEAGRKKTIKGSNGKVVNYSYDPMGRISSIDDCGSITKYTYTGTGKLTSVIDALGNETRYTYNELDLLCRIERFDGKSSNSETDHVTVFEHDLSGKLISVTDALGQKDLYYYNENGELKSQTDRDGNETIYTRDKAGNITGIRYSDGEEIKYSYDALNKLKEIQDHLGITKIKNDAVGRVIAVTDPDNQTVNYEYGPRDEKTAIVYPDGKRAQYKYDAFGKLTELKEIKASGLSGSIYYSYDPYGRLIKKSFANGTMASYEYNQGGHLKSLVNYDKDGVLDRFQYSYDTAGYKTGVNRLRRDLDGVSGAYTYSYDALGRLTETVKNGLVKSRYEYDAFGNRISQISEGVETTYLYDELDRLIAKSDGSFNSLTEDDTLKTAPEIVTKYDYDKRGNLIAEYENDILTKRFSFNDRGLIEKSEIDIDKNENKTVVYDYNYLNQRISKKAPNEEIKYLTDITRDHYNLLAQTINGKKSTFTYDDNVVSFDSEGEKSYYLLDDLGSTINLTDSKGEAYHPYAFDEFGIRLDPKTGEKNEGSIGFKDAQPLTFTGYREEENGLYFAQVRSYDPRSGRFTSEDLVRGILEKPESINHYQYCHSNPISYVDLNGKFELVLDLLLFLTIGIVCTVTYVSMVNAAQTKPIKINSRSGRKKQNSAEKKKEDSETNDDNGKKGEKGNDNGDNDYENGSSRPSSKKLRENMNKKGIKEPSYPNAAHHIVAGGATNIYAEKAREILYSFHIDINDPANGVFLPTVRGVSEAAYHRTLHTIEYYKAVYDMLKVAQSREECIEILQEIARELQNGTFTY